MGKINVLSFEVANLIAAGEVVDRPASVLKELLENAVDSGADTIIAEIKNGGVSFIRVSDNGCGIAAEDLPLAVKRHATSKISGAEDLDGILTLGFRGEALAAISAVSNIRIITKTRDAHCGTRLESIAGEITSVSETGCPDGTTIIVEDLFANVPARRKFLKRDAAESMASAATVEKIALSHPEIAFKLIVDGSIKFSTAGDGILHNTIFALLGREFAHRLIKAEGESDGIKISGYVGRSDNVRANRNYQNFFVNGRYVKSRTAMAAIEQAYHSYIAPEKFPVCVLFIDIHPAAVDVNVHPAKLEVKFSNEKLIFESVYYAVRSALDANDKKQKLPLKGADAREIGTVPDIDVHLKNRGGNTALRGIPVKNAFLPIEERGERRSEQVRFSPPVLSFGSHLPADVIRKDHSIPYNKFGSSTVDKISYRDLVQEPNKNSTGATTQNIEDPSAEKAESKNTSIQNKSTHQPYANLSQISPDKGAETTQTLKELPVSYRIIGEAFHCYILVETEDRLLIIDKHAAHERIIFERLCSAMKIAAHAPQMLLLSIDVTLSAEEFAAAMEYRDEIVATGFDYTTVNDNKTVCINRLPDMIMPKDAADIFTTIVDRLAKDTGNATITREILYEQALYQAACKAALKAGKIDAPEHIAWLCDTLMQLPDITVCPHGRPVVTEMTKRYIDRQFLRG